MGNTNTPRVILGGIVAGFVANILEYLLHDVVLKAEHMEAMKALGKTMPEGGSTIAVWMIYGFAWGIVTIALYAAIRPRFGPGAMTAIRAAVVSWFLGAFLMGVAMWNMTVMPFSVTTVVGELVIAIFATLAGAAVYKEAA
jgi:hypothetical protein